MSTDSMQGWEVKTSTGKHFEVLDGMRGIAILMVVAFHALYTNPQSGAISRLIGGLIGTGWMGVPIFFVLSGFLISYPFFRQRDADHQFWYLRGYAQRRIGKIIPPYYLSIVIFTIYYFVRFLDPGYIVAALQWAAGLPNFILAARDFHASYWSLLVEAHFYILLPLLFFLTKGLKSRPTAICLFLILLLLPLIARQLTWPEHSQTLPRDTINVLMVRFPCQLDFFAWGVFFAGVFFHGQKCDGFHSLHLFGYVGLAFLVATLGFYIFCIHRLGIFEHPTRWSTEVFHLLPGLSVFLMLFFVFDPDCLGSRLLSQSWLRFVGIVSYEWFLFHQPVVVLFHDIFGDTRGSIMMYVLKTIAPLGLTFVASVIVYRYFSLPLMKRIRGEKARIEF
jgi:peptidoglycan/LPS O-acetylase OafA/YrhL